MPTQHDTELDLSAQQCRPVAQKMAQKGALLDNRHQAVGTKYTRSLSSARGPHRIAPPICRSNLSMSSPPRHSGLGRRRSFHSCAAARLGTSPLNRLFRRYRECGSTDFSGKGKQRVGEGLPKLSNAVRLRWTGPCFLPDAQFHDVVLPLEIL